LPRRPRHALVNERSPAGIPGRRWVCLRYPARTARILSLHRSFSRRQLKGERKHEPPRAVEIRDSSAVPRRAGGRPCVR
jgi:hypothetical protein